MDFVGLRHELKKIIVGRRWGPGARRALSRRYCLPAAARRVFVVGGGGAPTAYDRRRRRHWRPGGGGFWRRHVARNDNMLVMLCYVTMLVSYWRGQHKANICFVRNKAVLSLNIIASINMQQSPVSKSQFHRSKIEQFHAQYCENRSITLSHFNLHHASAITWLFSWTNIILLTTCGDCELRFAFRTTPLN